MILERDNRKGIGGFDEGWIRLDREHLTLGIHQKLFFREEHDKA